MSRPRIALLALHTSPLASPGGHKTGGMNVYVRELARQLARDGTPADIFTRRSSPSDPKVVLLDDGATVVRLDAAPPNATNDNLVALTTAFADEAVAWAAANGRTYDVVHSHYWVSGAAGIELARRWRVPHVVMFHTLGEVKNRVRPAEHEPQSRIEIERTVAAAADRIVCAGEHEAHMLEQLYGADRARIAIIPCGVDLDHFRPGDRAAARARLGLPEGPLALYVGRIEPLKGIDLLINAIAQVEPLSDGPEAVRPRLLVLGGDERAGDEVRALRDQAAALGIGEWVTFAGSIGRQELPLYYNAADVCVVPSFYESFGLVAVEAMACGTPVVASRVGGLTTTVRDGVTGYLVPWRCPEPFAERIELLLANTHLRQSLGRAARASVQRLGWDRIAESVLALYDEVRAASVERAS